MLLRRGLDSAGYARMDGHPAGEQFPHIAQPKYFVRRPVSTNGLSGRNSSSLVSVCRGSIEQTGVYRYWAWHRLPGQSIHQHLLYSKHPVPCRTRAGRRPAMFRRLSAATHLGLSPCGLKWRRCGMKCGSFGRKRSIGSLCGGGRKSPAERRGLPAVEPVRKSQGGAARPLSGHAGSQQLFLTLRPVMAGGHPAIPSWRHGSPSPPAILPRPLRRASRRPPKAPCQEVHAGEPSVYDPQKEVRLSPRRLGGES